MKKIFITLAAVGLILAGCSKNEETDFNSQSPDAIKFTPVTSRAAVSDLGTLKGDATGFKVYGTSASNPSAWYDDVNGTSYRYSGSRWEWAGTDAQWPTTANGYPMTFYAMYPASPAGVVVTAAAPATISGAVTIQSTAATQVDLLAAAPATTDAKPVGGTLSLTFNHILSKVNFGIVVGDDTDVYVQYAGIKNLRNADTYNYVAGSWSGTASGREGYDYYNDETPLTPAGTTPKETFAPGVKDEETPNPFYDGTHDSHLMLMPQTLTAWVPARPEPPTTDESHIALIYRLSNAGGEIGYSDATDYLDKYEYDDLTGWSIYTGILEGSNPYGDKPLFIKAGFPVGNAWAPGKGYTYNIWLGMAGSINGNYLDDTYYDEDGYDTGIPIVGKKPGDPVTDGTINFEVEVTTWEDEALNV